MCCKYSNKWRFKFSVPKCAVMIFGTNVHNREFKLGHETIEEASIFIHLGTPLYTHSKLEKEMYITRCGC